MIPDMHIREAEALAAAADTYLAEGSLRRAIAHATVAASHAQIAAAQLAATEGRSPTLYEEKRLLENTSLTTRESRFAQLSYPGKSWTSAIARLAEAGEVEVTALTYKRLEKHVPTQGERPASGYVS